MTILLLLTFAALTQSFTIVPQLNHWRAPQKNLYAETNFLEAASDIDDTFSSPIVPVSKRDSRFVSSVKVETTGAGSPQKTLYADTNFLEAARDVDDSFPSPIVPASKRDSRLLLSSRVKVETTDAGSLRIFIPKVGIKSENLGEVGFTASWLGIIGYWTVGMVQAGMGPLGLAFSVPFWMAGASMANKSIIDPATAVQLKIGVHGWSLEKKLLGSKTVAVGEGPTWQLNEAVVDSDMEVNGKPLTSVQLHSVSQHYSFGHALKTKEKEFVAREINEWLKRNDEEILRV